MLTKTKWAGFHHRTVVPIFSITEERLLFSLSSARFSISFPCG
ncbi:hypothetical protein QHW22_14825 [Legionella pneumophila]|nr:hypothetical protein [Legionella pneumophila]AGH54193.1 hypothetical protein LPE509_02102 [Legionella pneumophila subsp. pneumophila LPE509]MDI0435095.1 hypothetical protein [Legionella pneumophila]